ncbi:MAG: HEAT repeat domain-containing protein, partial [Lentisphaeraceae bacterium]|nr:HEAT repeat domain-containing protein [Lentisphaeraceae bacterium]
MKSALFFLSICTLLHSTFGQELTVEKFAEKPNLVNPVALSFDNNGKAYVANARRRGGGSLDLRRIRFWVKDDLTFTSVEEREAFYKKNLTPENSKDNGKVIKHDFNKDGIKDWKDLYFPEDPFTTHLDTDGDGVADQHDSVFNPVERLGTGLAAGVLWHDNHLYLMHEPNLYKYSDSNGDGKFDKREILSTGYSVHIGQGGHNTSGLAVGPDGRLYWSVADKGFNATSADGKHNYPFPHRGAIMRSELDGSNLEVFALGVRNAQELAFDKYGNLFSVDNDGDYKSERERFLYLIEGGQTGWRLHWQWHSMQEFAAISGEKSYNVWMEEKMSVTYNPDQPAYLVPPISLYKDGPCGMYYNPGAALNSKFKDHLFHASGSEVTAFRVENEGASFKMVDEKVIAKGKVLTGLAMDPNGALYVGSCMSYPNYPAANGFILKIDDKNSDLKELRNETAAILKSGFSGLKINQLYDYLSHEDLRVRRDSQFELAKQGPEGLKALTKAALSGKTLLSRLHGIWGVGQVARKNPQVLGALKNLVNDKEVEVRTNLIRVIGDAAYTPAVSDLINVLKADPSMRVRSLAAIAIGKLKTPDAISPLIDLAIQNADKDPWLRHSLVMGLVGSASEKPELLTTLAKHDNRSVRIVALLALRRLDHPSTADFLKDSDQKIVTEAARAIHDDYSIPAALPALADALNRTDITNEAFIRRAINANLRVGTSKCAENLKKFITSSPAPEKMKTTAIAALAFWEQPPMLDAVEGRHRKYTKRDKSAGVGALKDLGNSFIPTANERLNMIFIRAVKKINAPELNNTLIAIFNSSKFSSAKVDSLMALSFLKAPEFKDTLAKAAVSKDKKLKYAASSLSGKNDIKAIKKLLTKGNLQEKREALKNLEVFPGKEADDLIVSYMDILLKFKKEKEIYLEILECAKKRSVNSKTVTDAISRYNKYSQKGDRPYIHLMYGGDANNGKEIAFGHPAAQCIRCHKIDNEGGILGPDLSKVGTTLPLVKIAQSIMEPGADFSKGFGIITLNMKDGSTVGGTYQDETDSTYEILLADGKVQKVEKKDIKSESRLSPMPPMTAILSISEIRDLVAYM